MRKDCIVVVFCCVVMFVFWNRLDRLFEVLFCDEVCWIINLVFVVYIGVVIWVK